ncbi:MAG: hypothetical protein ACPGOY_11995 [Rhodospirillaceae bacterium]
MPTEMRRLIFLERELAEAINAVLKKEWSKIQVAQDKARAMGKVENLDGGGVVTKLRFNSDDPLAVTAVTKTARGNVAEREFSQNELIPVVIGYCRDLSIPVPRTGQKLLRRAKVGIALDITIKDWSKPGT